MMPLSSIQLCLYECDLYGTDVVAAFGEYCQQRTRLLRHSASLETKPQTLTRIVGLLMRGYEKRALTSAAS